MPAPKLSISISKLEQALDKLQGYLDASTTLEAKYQYFISEMIMLRLFSIFEDTVAEIAYKLAAGAAYTNGSTPAIISRAPSVSASRGLFLTLGRDKPVQNLKWTKARFIRESVQHIIPATEPFIMQAQIHGSSIDEMRKVRNVLAHNTSSAKGDFKEVVRQAYGANVNVGVGAFLTSTRRNTTSNIRRYLRTTRIILKDIASGT